MSKFEELLLIVFVSLGGIIAGLAFLYGRHRGKQNSRFRMTINVDPIFLPKTADELLLTMGDRVASIISFGGSIIVLLIGLLSLLDIMAMKRLVNLSIAWIVMAIVLGWLGRLIFVWVYRNTPKEQIPNIWPFRRYQGVRNHFRSQ